MPVPRPRKASRWHSLVFMPTFSANGRRRRIAPYLHYSLCAIQALGAQAKAGVLDDVEDSGPLIRPRFNFYIHNYTFTEPDSGASWYGEPESLAPATPASADRGVADAQSCPMTTSMPVVLASGNKVLDQLDFRTASGDFVMTRSYSDCDALRPLSSFRFAVDGYSTRVNRGALMQYPATGA